MRLAAAADILRYHGASMQDVPSDYGLSAILEQPQTATMRQPDFVLDLSGRGLTANLPERQLVHGSYLVERRDALLFGMNNLVTREGYWCNESRAFKHQYLQYLLQYLRQPSYNHAHPAFQPKFKLDGNGFDFDVLELAQSGSVQLIEMPVFLATPQEPEIWGRWISTVIPKVKQYQRHGDGRKFLCHVENQWQQAVLLMLGIKPEQVMPHDPGRTYICRDVMTVEYSDTDLQMSLAEREICAALVRKFHADLKTPERLFVARLTRSKANPHYRVLLNEEDLAQRLLARGFSVIEPEHLPLQVQLTLFAQAREIVFTGGSAIFNAAFCASDAKVVTLEASDSFILSHSRFFASRDLAHGVIFGRQDQAEPRNPQRNWELDIEPALAAISQYTAG